MAGTRLRRPKITWGERLLMLMASFNAGLGIGTYLITPASRAEALSYLALAVSFTVWLDLRWRA